jgi:hypothetical protein
LLHVVQALADFRDAAVLQAVVLGFRATPGRKRMRDKELQREAEQRRGLQEVGSTFARNPQDLDDCVRVACAPARHGGCCKKTPPGEKALEMQKVEKLWSSSMTSSVRGQLKTA